MREITNHRGHPVTATSACAILANLLDRREQLSHRNAITKGLFVFSFVQDHETGFCVSRENNANGIFYEIGNEHEYVTVCPDDALLVCELFMELISQCPRTSNE